MENAPELGLVDLALRVSRAPVAPLGMSSPDRVTRDLLAQGAEGRHGG
jgi:hypothetical protein